MPNTQTLSAFTCPWVSLPVLGLGRVAAETSEPQVVRSQFGATARVEDSASVAVAARPNHVSSPSAAYFTRGAT